MITLNIIIFIIACLVLVRSGTWVIQSLSRIAAFLKWSEFVVAFIVIALVSSLPELFIGIFSALHKIPEVSFGNIIGANVINLTLAVGLAVLFLRGNLQVERKIVRRDAFFTALAALFPLILIFDGELSRIDGFISVIFFLFYIVWLFQQKERFPKIYNNQITNFKQFFKDIFIFFGGMGLIIVSAEFVINSAVELAESFGVSPAIIGILFIGAGTALPETYFVVRAAMKQKQEIILGNLMGSVVITALFVLGIVAMISPIKIDNFSPYFTARIFLFFSALLFLMFVQSDQKITKKEAFLLILVYLAFVIVEFLMK